MINIINLNSDPTEKLQIFSRKNVCDPFRNVFPEICPVIPPETPVEILKSFFSRYSP